MVMKRRAIEMVRKRSLKGIDMKRRAKEMITQRSAKRMVMKRKTQKYYKTNGKSNDYKIRAKYSWQKIQTELERFFKKERN